MTKTEIIENLNKLLSYAELYEEMVDFSRSNGCCAHFSHFFNRLGTYYTFLLSDEHRSLYANVFWSIYRSGSLQEKYSIEFVEKKFHDFLIKKKIKDSIVVTKDYDKFYNSLNTAKPEQISVFCKLYGVDVNTEEPLKIGCFTLYNYSLHKKQILELTKHTSVEKFEEYHHEFQNHSIWISTEIATVDKDKAYELALYRFEVFQGICQFFFDVNRYNAYCVCVCNDIAVRFDSYFVVSKSANHESFANHIRRHENIEAINLLKIHTLFNSLIDQLFLPEKNEINERIKYAFVTYGRIIHERTSVQQLTLYITAIESLLEYKVTDTTELVSSFLSGMICNDLETFNEIKKHFKFIYGLRSEISHGSRITVLKGDLEYAQAYCVTLILKFISDGEILPITKSKDLKLYLESKVKRLELSE